MGTDTFAQRWADKERQCGLGELSDGMVCFDGELPGMDEPGRQLLIESGLPCSASPCLRFEDTCDLPRLEDMFLADEWSEQQKADLARYRMLGSDRTGNPICLEEATGKVWLLDHDSDFQKRQFMNTSVVHLAECLLACLGEGDAGQFEKAVRATDPAALAEDAFWFHEIDLMRAE